MNAHSEVNTTLKVQQKQYTSIEENYITTNINKMNLNNEYQSYT